MVFPQFLLMGVCLVFVFVAELAEIVAVLTLATMVAETALLHRARQTNGEEQLAL